MGFTRKTKIIATIGPASESRDILSRLITEGINAARLNFSHDTHAGHKRRIRIIRTLEKKYVRAIAIIGDLQGPKMRVGILPKEGLLLRDEEKIVLDVRATGYQDGIIPIPSSIFAEIKSYLYRARRAWPARAD